MNTPLDGDLQRPEQPHRTARLQHRRKQLQREVEFRPRRMSPQPFTSTTGCAWSRPSASATSASAGNYLDMEANFFNAAASDSASLLNPLATFPGHDPVSQLEFAGRHHQRDSTSTCSGRTPRRMTSRCSMTSRASLACAPDSYWNNLIIQPGNSYQAALGRYLLSQQSRTAAIAQACRLNPDGSCTFTGVITPCGRSRRPEINRYSGVLGAWFRKGTALHANVDAAIRRRR